MSARAWGFGLPTRLLAAMPAIVILAILGHIWCGPRFSATLADGGTFGPQTLGSFSRIIFFVPLVLGVMTILSPPPRLRRIYPLLVLAIISLMIAYAAVLVFAGVMDLNVSL